LTAPAGTGGALCGLGAQAADAALTDAALILFDPLVSMIGPLPEVFKFTPCSRMHVTNFAGYAGPAACVLPPAAPFEPAAFEPAALEPLLLEPPAFACACDFPAPACVLTDEPVA
jgi:hypothetical protein